MLAVAIQPWAPNPRFMGPNEDEAEAVRLGRALANLRERMDMSQAEAAVNFGVNSGAAWGKYEQGIAPSIFRPDTQRRLVAALGASLEDLLIERARITGDPPPARPTPASAGVTERPRRQFESGPHPGMAAVYGLAAGEGEVVAITAGSEIRYVPMHPAQRGYGRIGAVEIVGESMFPRWKPRELAYFVFDLPGNRGDDVVVETRDGTAMVKEYIGRTPTNLLLREWYPAERSFEVPLSQVRAIHAVVG